MNRFDDYRMITLNHCAAQREPSVQILIIQTIVIYASVSFFAYVANIFLIPNTNSSKVFFSKEEAHP